MGAGVEPWQPSALLSSLPHLDKSPALKKQKVLGDLSSVTDQQGQHHGELSPDLGGAQLLYVRRQGTTFWCYWQGCALRSGYELEAICGRSPIIDHKC